MNEYAGIDERIIWNVKMCAKTLKRTSIFRSTDIDDIEQELMCEVISCMPKFDERKGSLEHFIRKVLARRSINLLRTFSCAKRGVFVSEYISNDNSDEKTINENIISLDLLMNNLPSRYKVLCKLLMKYSISEAAEIIGKTRATLYRDLKKIASFANCESNSEDQILSMFKKGVNMKNLSVLETSSAKEISALEVHDLMDLNDQVAKLINHAKELKEKLDDGLNLRFAEAVKNNQRSERGLLKLQKRKNS
jgi:RNA polymerase sigma-70 factor (ECF subfamily)